MASVNRDVTIYASEDKTITVTVQDSNGDAIDISGYTIEYAAQLDNDTYITKNTTSGISITDGTSGEFEITLSSSDTSGIEITKDVLHECRITDGSSNQTVLFTGTLSIKRSLVNNAA